MARARTSLKHGSRDSHGSRVPLGTSGRRRVRVLPPLMCECDLRCPWHLGPHNLWCEEPVQRPAKPSPESDLILCVECELDEYIPI